MAKINSRAVARFLDPSRNRRRNEEGRRGKSDTGAPLFPGMQGGMSMKDIRKFISEQPRQIGFTTQVNTGDNKITVTDLPGDSRLLLGINWNLATISVSDTYSLSVNNVLIIDSVPVVLNSTQPGALGIAYTMEPYIRVYQPLSGTDKIELVYTAANPATIQFVLWYI